MSRISTKLHRMLEVAPDDMQLADIAHLPHFLIDWNLTDLLVRRDVDETLRAIIQVGLAHLPYPDMVVEVQPPGGDRWLVRLTEREDHFETRAMTLSDAALQVLPRAFVQARDHMPPLFTKVENPYRYPREVVETAADAALFAAGCALVLLHTSGIEKEIVTPEPRLNRARKKRGKPAIREFTYLHIGTVYDRDGKAVNPGGTGHGKMPMHFRKGHVRNQFYGKDRAERKLIYVPACIVNYDPGETMPVPRTRVKA